MQQATSVSDLSIANRTLVMGIVNVTEDSFSDGGKWLDVDAAINHARELVAQGADMMLRSDTEVACCMACSFSLSW